jgi:hypothetical protein
MSLTLGTQPGFTEIADSTFDVGNPVTDTAMKAMNGAAKFGAVRNEQFYGYYCNGETVLLPVSPADGYQYSRSELLYSFSTYYSGAGPSGGCNGTQTAPAGGNTSGAGQMLFFTANVDQASGLVETQVAYYKSAQQNTTDGVLLVITHAQRSR